ARLLERAFAVHHACLRPLAQLLDHLRGNLWHKAPPVLSTRRPIIQLLERAASVCNGRTMKRSTPNIADRKRFATRKKGASPNRPTPSLVQQTTRPRRVGPAPRLRQPHRALQAHRPNPEGLLALRSPHRPSLR